jgi:hypothetical protein
MRFLHGGGNGVVDFAFYDDENEKKSFVYYFLKLSI